MKKLIVVVFLCFLPGVFGCSSFIKSNPKLLNEKPKIENECKYELSVGFLTMYKDESFGFGPSFQFGVVKNKKHKYSVDINAAWSDQMYPLEYTPGAFTLMAMYGYQLAIVKYLSLDLGVGLGFGVKNREVYEMDEEESRNDFVFMKLRPAVVIGGETFAFVVAPIMYVSIPPEFSFETAIRIRF